MANSNDTLATMGFKVDIPAATFMYLSIALILPIVIYFIFKTAAK